MAFSYLDYMKTAEKACKLRELRSRRVVSSTGVIFVSVARKRLKARNRKVEMSYYIKRKPAKKSGLFDGLIAWFEAAAAKAFYRQRARKAARESAREARRRLIARVERVTAVNAMALLASGGTSI